MEVFVPGSWYAQHLSPCEKTGCSTPTEVTRAAVTGAEPRSGTGDRLSPRGGGPFRATDERHHAHPEHHRARRPPRGRPAVAAGLRRVAPAGGPEVGPGSAG